ncbi:hypothetical protein ACIP9H_28335 [Streptomyces sp. NPDC088732]|uniref:hypothetical protein n=1 Tax=Streptomyces sp. NPDC088732 TaxID=3365879 RepID=UPI00382B8FE8
MQQTQLSFARSGASEEDVSNTTTREWQREDPMTGTGRLVVKVTAIVAALVSGGLLVMLMVADLGKTAEVASVIGTVVALAMAVVSVIALYRAGGSGGAGGGRVRAGGRGIAIGGDVVGSALGDRSRVTGSHGTPTTSRQRRRVGPDVKAGRHGKAIGGDVRDSALGDDSIRR